MSCFPHLWFYAPRSPRNLSSPFHQAACLGASGATTGTLRKRLVNIFKPLRSARSYDANNETLRLRGLPVRQEFWTAQGTHTWAITSCPQSFSFDLFSALLFRPVFTCCALREKLNTGKSQRPKMRKEKNGTNEYLWTQNVNCLFFVP